MPVGLAGYASALTRAVVRQIGILGKWELTETATTQRGTGQGEDGGRAWTGPLNLKYIGFCGRDRLEEKTGEMRLSILGPIGEITAPLLERETCTFRETPKDGHDGLMTCPGRRGVPMMLSIE